MSNIRGAEPGAMWYFRFGWVDIKKFQVLGSRPKALIHVSTFPKIACTFRSAVKSKKDMVWGFMYKVYVCRNSYV